MDGDEKAVSEGMGGYGDRVGSGCTRPPLRESSRWGPPSTLAQASGDDSRAQLTGPSEADPGEDSILMTI